MQPDRIVDVASSRNNRPDRPSTCLPSFKIPGASSKLLLYPLPSLLNLPSQDLSDMHSSQMVVNFSRKGGLPPLILDVASSCSHSDVKLPSLSDAYWDDSRDDQYKLNDLWPENISDSLPPELQRFQLTSPVRTQHTRNEYIDPAQLILANPSEEKEDWMNEVYLPSHYSPEGSIIVSPLSPHSLEGSIIVSPGSNSSGSPESVGSRSPSPSFRRDLGSLCQRLGLTIPIQSRDGSISPDALSLTLSPVPPLISPITSPITPPSDEGTFDEDASDEETSDGYSPDDEGEDYEILIGF
ncbi:hypothetical protein M405DRAFT_75484 [Rhizopogon salebrosus TDB-379]|nr:hypothetical protein M405DRAFT_75484 [Rhizopogon salebrosus TDB-379]